MSEPTWSMKLDSIGFRQLAEYASSCRAPHGESRHFTATPLADIPGYYTVTSERGEVQPGPIMVPCQTATIQPLRPPVTRIEIASGSHSLDLSQYDSVFWSEAAVEKFVIPYYASKYQWAACQWLTALSQAFYGFIPDLSSGAADASPRDPSAEQEIPFAIAHYPKSDYAPLLADEFYVLFIKPNSDGAVYERPVSDYLAHVQPGGHGAGRPEPRTV